MHTSVRIYLGLILWLALVAGSMSSSPLARADEPLDDAPPAAQADVTSTEHEGDAVEMAADSSLGGLSGGTIEVSDSTSVEILSEEFQDKAFDQHVDLRLVSDALSTRNASLLTDVALQLAEGERVLLRQHKSGVTSQGLLEKAAKLAIDGQDKTTLDRLMRAAETLQQEDLVQQLATAEKIGGASRATNPALTVSLDSLDLNAVIVIKRLFDAIREAELMGDHHLLDDVESQLKDATDVTDAQRAAIEQLVKQTREAMPPPGTAEDDPIAKLSAASRGWGIKDLDPTNREQRCQQGRTRFRSRAIENDESQSSTRARLHQGLRQERHTRNDHGRGPLRALRIPFERFDPGGL